VSERTEAFVPVVASGSPPQPGAAALVDALVLGPWIVRRSAAPGIGGSLVSRRGNLIAPTLILARRRRLG
jgi:hypothetical protein